MIIHLVDDEEVILEISSEIISELRPEAKVYKFRSGKEYYDFIVSLDFEKPDIVLLDIRMPELSGFQVIQRLEKMKPNPLNNSDLYIVSSTLSEKDHQEALSHPTVKAFIAKPISFEQMMDIFG